MDFWVKLGLEYFISEKINEKKWKNIFKRNEVILKTQH